MKRPPNYRAHNYKAERNAEVYRRRKNGESFAVIGKAVGINKNRVRDVFYKEERIREYGNDYIGWVERNGK